MSQSSTFVTPVAAKRKVIRRTNAQIEADTATKKAATVAKAELSASKESHKKKVETPHHGFYSPG